MIDRNKIPKPSSLLLIIGILLLCIDSFSQKRISTEEYIQIYKDIAIKKMKTYRIPASITLAQGILESGSGNSRLATKANNHFGIKCHKGWTGKSIRVDDDAKNECFRKYKKAEDSYNDHSEFLTQRGRYSFLFEYQTTDYKSWAEGLKKAGYATNPKYPELLIRIIEKYKLYQYDQKVGGKQIKKDSGSSSYVAVSPNYKQVGESPKGRPIYTNNGKKLLLIKEGDTFNKLAKEFNIYTWQFYKYNEVNKQHILHIGEVIYLQKKKRKSEKKYKYHRVQQGESIHEIAQHYGVRLSSLRKRNNLPEGVQPAAKTRLKLR